MQTKTSVITLSPVVKIFMSTLPEKSDYITLIAGGAPHSFHKDDLVKNGSINGVRIAEVNVKKNSFVMMDGDVIPFTPNVGDIIRELTFTINTD